MGAAASIETVKASCTPKQAADLPDLTTCVLKKLPEAIEEALFVHEKFPYIIDPTEQAARFLKYQMGSFVTSDDIGGRMNPESLNRNLVGALQHGRTMTIKFPTTEKLNADIFKEGEFPMEVLDRMSFFKPEVWQSLIKPERGDPEVNEFIPSQEFVFIICSNEEIVPEYCAEVMHVIKVTDAQRTQGEDSIKTGGGDEMDGLAAMFGAQEIVRNSPQLVEAGFDGDIDEIKAWIDKGYHHESMDGRKHTALSEASCQGHLECVKFLLDLGANPNAVSDTDRSPLWRAAFNNHIEVVDLLLKAGADPDLKDKVSGESAFDVSHDDELRNMLVNWDRKTTERLMEQRQHEIMAKIEERIKTSVEREAYAKMQLNKDLVEKAENGDIDGIKEILLMVAEEAEQTNTRPRVTAECRNVNGQSLLSIAAQKDDLELATFLLTHWKKCDEDNIFLAEGEQSMEGKVFKTSPNTRDLKGWTCTAIAVFHNSLKVLQLLLEHGGDPNIRSSYNKNAWDLAKDELDAAEHVVKDNSSIREVLTKYDISQKTGNLFGVGNVSVGESDVYKDLDKDGTAMVMNIEMNKVLQDEVATNTDKKGKVGSAAKEKTTKSSGGKKNALGKKNSSGGKK